MGKKIKFIIIVIVIIVIAVAVYMLKKDDKSAVKQIDLNNNPQETSSPANTGPVSPISGLSCENYNKRPVAVMQPSDLPARPAAGFSEADIVFEMPQFTAGNTRLMGVYICNLPKEIGSIRSARHDFIALAKGLDAYFIHWGGSAFALELLKQNIIDHVDCLNTNYCARWDWKNDPKMRMEDSGHITSENILKSMTDKGIKSEGNLSGYPHQEEAKMEDRPNGGRLRVAFAEPCDVEYEYDKNSNSYMRIWNEVQDTDRNNNQKIAPKNIVVMFAKSEQIRLDIDYAGRGVQSPWDLIPKEEQAGINDIPGAPGIGRYNNVEIGDPWYDQTDNGLAKFYINGKEINGTWKKNKAKLESKLYFYDESGQEVKFVPGQIWVEVLEPGQNLRWTPAT